MAESCLLLLSTLTYTEGTNPTTIQLQKITYELTTIIRGNSLFKSSIWENLLRESSKRMSLGEDNGERKEEGSAAIIGAAEILQKSLPGKKTKIPSE